MRLQFDGQDRTENVAPYSLAGDTNGLFYPANLFVGTHTLTATPYPQPNLGGTPGASITITFSVVDSTSPPILLTEENSDRAIAYNCATFVPGPFAITTEQNFSSDKRTRVMLFVTNLDSSTGTFPSDIVVHAENSQLGALSLPVEHIVRVPNFEWLTQVRVILPDGLVNAGDVWVRIILRGVSSNQAHISIRQPALAAVVLPSRMTLPEDWWIAPNRRLRFPSAATWPRKS